MFRGIFYLFATAASSLASPLSLRSQDVRAVQLPTGKYIGAHDSNTSTTTYYAIPFAHSSRFELSELVDTQQHLDTNAVINATTHGPACVNFNLPPPFDKSFDLLTGTKPIQPSSEDCLTMDVYVPDGNYEAGTLPVLFYTPGGGFLIGASFVYDMRPIVSRSAAVGKPFIAVAINYRLGPLGFLNPSTWAAEHKVNLGLLDQVNALRYVKKYISAFGGDPEKVTIMGESAGGESTMHQLLWTHESLFRSAWMMSTPASTEPFLARKPSYKDSLVKSYAKACGCTADSVEEAVTCLQQTNVSTLTKNSAAWEGSQTSSFAVAKYDSNIQANIAAGLGGFVRKNVFDAIRDGEFPKVPVAFSICRDEGTSLAIGFHSNSTQTTSILIDFLIGGRGLKGQQAADFTQQMLEAYPNDPALGCPFDGVNTTYGEGSQYKRMAAIGTDGTWAEGWSEFLDTFSAQTNTWGIIFEQEIKGINPAYGVVHGSDLLYYFPTLAGPAGDPRSYGQGDLVQAIHDAVINFVADGDPNGNSEPSKRSNDYQWPLYSDTGMVTALNATQVATAVSPPYRPGFAVLHHFLRPGPFVDVSEKRGQPAALSLQS